MTTPKIEYDIHPLAKKMPELSPEDRGVLIDDIREVGLLEPITLYEGKILDGRSRYHVCKALQREFKASERRPPTKLSHGTTTTDESSITAVSQSSFLYCATASFDRMV